MDQKNICKSLGLSEKGLEMLSNFIDSDGSHFSLLSWIKLYMDKLVGPQGDISDSSFPFRGDTFDNLRFYQPYNPRWEGRTFVKIINYTLPENMKIWMEKEATKATRNKEQTGDLMNKYICNVFLL